MIKKQLFFKVVFFVLFAALSWPQGISAEAKTTSQSFKYKDTENDIIFEAKITEGEYTINKSASFKRKNVPENQKNTYKEYLYGYYYYENTNQPLSVILVPWSDPTIGVLRGPSLDGFNPDLAKKISTGYEISILTNSGPSPKPKPLITRGNLLGQLFKDGAWESDFKEAMGKGKVSLYYYNVNEWVAVPFEDSNTLTPSNISEKTADYSKFVLNKSKSGGLYEGSYALVFEYNKNEVEQIFEWVVNLDLLASQRLTVDLATPKCLATLAGFQP